MPQNSLEEILDRHAEKLEEILKASESLQHAVIENNSDILKEASENLRQAQGELREIEDARMALLTEEGKENMTLKEYIQGAGDRRHKLDGLFSKISGLVLHLKNMQEANTMLLREGLSYIRVQLESVEPRKRTAGIYGPGGKIMSMHGTGLDKVG